MLSSKGMDCVGCTEKAEYVTKAFESLSKPLVEEKTKSSSSEEAKTDDNSANKPEEKGKVDKIKKEELDDVSLKLLAHTFQVLKYLSCLLPIHSHLKYI